MHSAKLLQRAAASRHLAAAAAATQRAAGFAAAAAHQAPRRRPLMTATPHAAAAAAAASTSQDAAAAALQWRPGAEIRMLYDGECVLCKREVGFLRGRDAAQQKIDFVDIAAPSYDPACNAGVTYEQAMERIHAVLPDGRVVAGVDVFRLLYEAVGLGYVYAFTKNPTLGALAERVYNVWAKYRVGPLLGREPLEVVLARRRAGEAGSMCGAEGGEGAASCEVGSGGGAGGGSAKA